MRAEGGYLSGTCLETCEDPGSRPRELTSPNIVLAHQASPDQSRLQEIMMPSRGPDKTSEIHLPAEAWYDLMITSSVSTFGTSPGCGRGK